MLVTSTTFLFLICLVELSSALFFPFKAPEMKTSLITLDYGIFKGKVEGTTTSYLGMPFGQAKRFEQATIFSSNLSGIQDATKYGKACSQMHTLPTQGQPLDKAFRVLTTPLVDTTSEDCFNINVQIPTGTPANASLPIAFFIHGGAWILGSGNLDGPSIGKNGNNLVAKSIEMKQPIIYVSANYRLHVYGLLAGKEMMRANATNLFLRDQRLAMQWVQKYISNFGGDPTKVTLIGTSAGSISASMHLSIDNGNPKGLFRGAMMWSGGPIRLLPQSSGQAQFDQAAKFCGCDQSVDKLACLKTVPHQKLQDYVEAIPGVLYNGLVLPFLPRPDGSYLKKSPFDMVSQGTIADIPIVIGDAKDEGTLFSLYTQLTVTTDADFRSWVKTVLFPHANATELNRLFNLYPEDAALGSPFGTGNANQLSPQYKRLASLEGDFFFQQGRRHLLDHAPNKNKWTYQSELDLSFLEKPFLFGQNPTKLDRIPFVGSFHGSDVQYNMFGAVPESKSRNTLIVMTSVISFVNTLDPNNAAFGNVVWPKYDSNSKPLLNITEAGPAIIRDDFREEQLHYLTQTRSFTF